MKLQDLARETASWLHAHVVANTPLTLQAFDPQGSGRISLDFSQFIYAASNCR